jgi:hypothetical protein
MNTGAYRSGYGRVKVDFREGAVRQAERISRKDALSSRENRVRANTSSKAVRFGCARNFIRAVPASRVTA